jgi:hypothetical protein
VAEDLQVLFRLSSVNCGSDGAQATRSEEHEATLWALAKANEIVAYEGSADEQPSAEVPLSEVRERPNFAHCGHLASSHGRLLFRGRRRPPAPDFGWARQRTHQMIRRGSGQAVPGNAIEGAAVELACWRLSRTGSGGDKRGGARKKALIFALVGDDTLSARGVR